MNNSEKELANSLKTVLDRHGHSFHYAVMRRAKELEDNGDTVWRLYGTEIPVTVKGQVFHIDFVLKHRDINLFLIAECKRAEPAKANWCFVRAPFTFPIGYKDELYFDAFLYPQESIKVDYGCAISYSAQGIYEIGHELKTGAKGDGQGGDNSQINKAVAQALRGSSGFINTYFKDRTLHTLDRTRAHYFIPAVFTTAKLYSSSDDISLASLETGFLPEDSIKLKKEDWFWFNHNRSNNLEHDINHSAYQDIYQRIDKQYIRSTAIVSVYGLDNFLTWNMGNWISSLK